MQIEVTPIGYINNSIRDPKDGFKKKDNESTIELLPQYKDGLNSLNEHSYADIIFYFHKSKSYKLITPIYTGEIKGVFASRSPNRPNSIGVTRVKITDIYDNIIKVTGLDAINGTPLLDIKPCDTSFLNESKTEEEIYNERIKQNPRAFIIKDIRAEKKEKLLKQAGQLHGHYCPGLSLGVLASIKAVNLLNQFSDGMEQIIAVTETNNCFADGVQYITGCSFGNNALIFEDIGKTAFTLTARNGKGVRISVKKSIRDIESPLFRRFRELFKKVVEERSDDTKLKSEFKQVSSKCSFEILTQPFNNLFKIEYVDIELPRYAPIFDSIICNKCNETIMKSRITIKDNKELCLKCAKKEYNSLTGDGIMSCNKF
ncbi:tRNA (N6-threonylcarbamoyladenosine(37)-N6)-methyltransferase TrmO [Marinilabiliaceae bacterium ANBcel2]|nr:tRNA (N6-threonylcarbamoyladenosine(37)-N6)-methyltransferase TrmO [Marinilabiliaceae bacterium ANBcel2]